MNIVLTGVSRGLGRAMVPRLIDAGHEVHGCARSKSAIDELTTRFPNPHSFHVVDLSDLAAVSQWAKIIVNEYGPPDLLINNAALINANATLWTVPPQEFDQLIDTNIKGMFYVIHEFLPAMIEAGRGIVVNFSSTWGRTASPEVAPYCATKWAVEGMTRSLAKELPSGLAAVPLNPGVIDTDMLRSCFGRTAGGFPGPDDWAERAVPFILRLSTADSGQPRDVP